MLRGLRTQFRSLRQVQHRVYSSVAPSTTRTTVLPNGLTVASEYIPNTSTASIGIYVDAGSRAETTKNNGTAHFLEHLAFKGTQTRSQQDIELLIENIGSHLNAYTSRENTVYYAKTLKDNIPIAVNILSDILTKSTLDKNAIERERGVIIRESEEVDQMHDEVVFDHLHEIVFANQPLGRTILGPIENIKKISQSDLRNYIKTNYKGDRMVLAAAGDVDHSELVKYAQKYFGHVPKSATPAPLGTPRGPLPTFHGGRRVLPATIPTTHIVFAIEGVSWSAPDYFVALATQAIIGNWDRALGVGTNSASPLSMIASKEPLANSYMSFSTSYADTGIWGVYMVLDHNLHDPNRIIQEIVKEWNRIKSGNITDEEVARAKTQLKAALVLSLDGSTAILEDMGRQIVTTGKRLTPEEMFEKVDVIKKDDIVAWANYRLKNNPVALVALGNVSKVPQLSTIEQQLNM